MTRKKNGSIKQDIIEKYDYESLWNDFSNSKSIEPQPFRDPDGEWHCGHASCMSDNAILFDLGDNQFKCGHCYTVYIIKETI